MSADNYFITPAGAVPIAIGMRPVSCFEKAKNSLPLRGKARFVKPRQRGTTSLPNHFDQR